MVIQEIEKRIRDDVGRLTQTDRNWQSDDSWARFEAFLSPGYTSDYGPQAQHALQYAHGVLDLYRGFATPKAEAEQKKEEPQPAVDPTPTTVKPLQPMQ